MRRARAACALVAAGAMLGGCSLGGDDEAERTRTVEVTTRVEVFADARGAERPFDPQRVYEREAPGVVTVFSVFGGGGVLDRGPEQEGAGSGFVLDGDGEIATNAHVVTTGQGDDLKRAKEVFVQFADGNQVDATIVGVDPDSDIALLRIDPAGLTLRPLPLGSSRALKVGAPVVAIGSPYGEPQSLSVGVISGLDRSIESLTGFSIDGAIQTDAAINRGNSGGPLVDARGQVLGINSQIRSTGGGGEGVGFAVPVDTVRRALDVAAPRRRDPLRVPRRAEHDDLPAARRALRAARRRGRLGAGRDRRRPGRRRRHPRRATTASPSRRARTRSAATSSPACRDSRSGTRRSSATGSWTSARTTSSRSPCCATARSARCACGSGSDRTT